MAKPLKQMPYQTLGDLLLTFPDTPTATDYRRDLNLDEAIATCCTRPTASRFSRELFASAPDQVVVVRLTADRPGRIDFRVGLQTPLTATVAADGDTLTLRGRNGDGNAATADGAAIRGALDVRARVRVLAEGGSLSPDGDAMVVHGADAATLLVAAATSYKKLRRRERRSRARIARHARPRRRARSFAALRAAHVADHQRLFRRVTLDLGRTARRRSADRRAHRALSADGGDPPLAALYFQFGRYLLISSSRPGSQPANLQGIWNDSINAAVGQQVHDQHQHRDELLAGASRRNLAECVEPLIAMVRGSDA